MLIKELLVCDDSNECDYARGGFFTTQKARCSTIEHAWSPSFTRTNDGLVLIMGFVHRNTSMSYTVPKTYLGSKGSLKCDSVSSGTKCVSLASLLRHLAELSNPARRLKSVCLHSHRTTVFDNIVACLLVDVNSVASRLAKIYPPCRDVLFEGYTDALSIKLMNKGLASRNLTIQCSRQTVVERDMYCQPIYDGDCTDVGFKVIHQIDERAPIRTRACDGDTRDRPRMWCARHWVFISIRAG